MLTISQALELLPTHPPVQVPPYCVPVGSQQEPPALYFTELSTMGHELRRPVYVWKDSILVDLGFQFVR